MNFSYQEIKQGLIRYFTKVEKYKLVKSKINSDVIYLYAIKNNFEFIVIAPNKLDSKLEEEFKTLVDKIKDSPRQIVKIIKLLIDPSQNNILEEENISTIICGEENLKLNLLAKFPRINLLSIKKDNDKNYGKKVAKISIEEEEQEFQSPEEIQKEYNKFQINLKANRLTTTWLIMAAFSAVPLILMFLGMATQVTGYAKFSGLGQLQQLFNGGTNYNLTIAGEQVWRILTYGFSTSSSTMLMNIFMVAIAGFALFQISKIAENTAGPFKLICSFLPAYVLTGFFVSVMMPASYVTAGIVPILAIVSGILILSVEQEKTPKATFAKLKMAWPMTLLVLIPLFFGSTYDYIPIIVGFAAGAMIQIIIKRGFKSWHWTFVIPFLVLIGLLIVPTVFILLPKYTTAIDQTTLIALELYLQHHLIFSIDQTNSIIDKIGWDMYFREGANGIFYVVPKY